MMKTYMVGGAVRDILMDRQPKDIDYVVVGSSPEEMIAQGYQQVGADFPVFIHPTTGEVYVLARTERKNGKGYNGFVTDHSPRVTLKEDLLRRDLTINAMAMDETDGSIIDPFKGTKHINDRVLKHVSKAFADDPVRVLRLARFRARYGAWTVHAGTRKLCKEMVEAGELDNLTKERVLKEFEKALSEPYAWRFFDTLHKLKALRVVLPHLDEYFDPGREVRRLIGEAEAVKLKYARMSAMFYSPVDFEDAYRVSTDWRRYRKMYMSYLLTIGSSVDTLYRMDAYRQKDLTEELFRDMKEAKDEDWYYLSKVMQAWDLTKDIGFDDLTEEEKRTLKGPAIAEAIRKKRDAISPT